jgi:hypothetical protein
MKYGKKFQIETYLPHRELLNHLNTVAALMIASDYNHVIFYQLLDKSLPVKSSISTEMLKQKQSAPTKEQEELVEILRPILKSS